MGRPSTKEKRTQEILDAYEACVVKYGVEGTTLELLAKEAGLARALLRHHVGNRDKLLDALLERFFERSDQVMQAFVCALPPVGSVASDMDESASADLPHRLDVFLTWLFSPDYVDTQLGLMASALIAVAPKYPDLSFKLARWVEGFSNVIEAELDHAFPKSCKEKRHQVAIGVLGIYFNADSLTFLSHLEEGFRKQCELSARLLVATLKP
ncbi:MAG: TetR family transcriptional regulator [Cohaesibacter sp.]|jgi:AcrR family transcriptional regulator|nr:TetR family transcriptional regulator [Cohaesibacter sp.]